MKTNNILKVAVVSALALGVSSQSFAQNAIEEITVTATKRATNLQDTPLAITAFTSDALAAKGVSDISDIAQLAPNLVFDTSSPIGGLSSGAAVFIRGIGNTDFSLTTDPGVGTYVDGVYVSRSVGGVLDVLDVERIEVLRGPQGTLFGRNTIGGAISIVTRKPAEELQGSVELKVGNLGRVNFRGSLDVPVNDKVRTSFAVSSKQRDGFIDRPLVGDELGDENKQALRGTLVLDATERLSLQVSADYTNIDEESAPSIAVGFTPGGGTVGFAEAEQGGDVPAALGRLITDYATTDLDRDISFGNRESFSEIEVTGLAFIADYAFDNHDLKYTASYRDTEARFSADADGTPFQITDLINPEYTHEQTSHELQLTGTLLDNRLKYAAGIYAFDEEGLDSVRVPVLLPIGAVGPFTNPDNTSFISNFTTVDNQSKAGYFQASYDINDTFTVTGGIRSTEDDKEYGYAQFLGLENLPQTPGFFPSENPPGLFLPLVGTGIGVSQDTFSETQFKFGLDANLENGTLLYYSYSEGFKSGGFVLRYVVPVPDALSFEPETLSSHEFGVKWQSADSRFRINSALFFSDYDDVQVTLFDGGGGPITANAGTAEIQGLELELTALLTDRLTLDLGYGYTDAEYTSLNAIPGLALAVDLNSKLVNTPENTLNLGLEFATQMGSKPLTLRADYSYTDDVFNDSQNSQFLFQDAVSLLGLNARLELNENTDLIAWVENATDERYIVTGNSNFGLGFHSAVVSTPREFGVTYRRRF